MTNIPSLPITVTVTEGGVTVESPQRTVSMSRFVGRAQRLMLDLGTGTHVIATARDIEDLPNNVTADIVGALTGA